ncbi:hypothetical protein Tco_0452295 [Tanacetum coccineum]
MPVISSSDDMVWWNDELKIQEDLQLWTNSGYEVPDLLLEALVGLHMAEVKLRYQEAFEKIMGMDMIEQAKSVVDSFMD